MGKSVDITITRTKYSVSEIIKTLTDNDWNLGDHIEYVDNEDFDWITTEILNYNNVLEKLEANFKSGKSAVITLYTAAAVPCIFFFSNHERVDNTLDPRPTITLSIDCERKKLNDSEITDFSYYLQLINSILDDNVEHFTCKEWF